MTTPESDGSGGGGGMGKSWVTFDVDEGANQQSPPSNVAAPAVIDAQSVQVNLENHHSATTSPDRPASVNRTISEPGNGVRRPSLPTPAPASTNTEARVTMSLSPTQLHNVPLHDPTARSTTPGTTAPTARPPVIRQGFSNGEVIVTLLPQNTCLPWITPAQFRPELVPEELMARGLTLTVEDYVQIMSRLVNDYRFTLYNVCYKRILMAWIFLGFVILLCVLFSGLSQLALFGAGIGWLLVNAVAIFFCMWVKIRLNKALEQCMAEINLQLLRHKILLGLDDRGKLSCHKVNLCFIYFDTHDCLSKLQEIIEEEENAGRNVTRGEGANAADGAKIPTLSQRLEIDDSDIIITGTTNTRISRQQDRARLLLARYSQRWVKAISRGNLLLNTGSDSSCPPLPARHCSERQCPCQYIQDHIHYKPQGWCSILRNLCVLPDFN